MTQIRHWHSIQIIRQPPGSRVCWAASLAMTLGGSESIRTVQAKARRGGVRLHTDGSLPVGDLPNVERLASRFARLRVADVRESPITIELIVSWLQRGRFTLLGGFNYPGLAALDHAVTFYAVGGDGSMRGTTIRLADPFNGLFRDDFEHFEEQIMADAHFVIHR